MYSVMKRCLAIISITFAIVCFFWVIAIQIKSSNKAYDDEEIDYGGYKWVQTWSQENPQVKKQSCDFIQKKNYLSRKDFYELQAQYNRGLVCNDKK